jgi:diguanylate cyclase (GGDEF)-like protein
MELDMRNALTRLGVVLLGLLAGVDAAIAAEPPAWAIQGDRIFLPAPDSDGATAMAQDSQGFLWVGSQGGLMRWDGYRFRSYAPDPGTPGALPDNFVTALHIDGRGQLWVGTSAGGLARYEPDTDGFSMVPLAVKGAAEFNVSAIIWEGRGGLWVGTGRGLIHVDGTNGRATPLQDAAFQGQQARVESLLRDRQGTLWVGTRHGLLRRAPSAVSFSPYPLPSPDAPFPVVKALFEDSAGTVWIGTSYHGAYMLGKDAPAVKAVRESGRVNALATDSVSAIIEARDGEVWIGTTATGLISVDLATGRTLRERHDGEQPTSLPNDVISCLFRDHNGLVWVGGASTLSHFDPGQHTISTFFGGSRPRRIVNDNSIASVLAMPDGKVWLNLDEGGIEILDPARGQFTRLAADVGNTSPALAKGALTTMGVAPDGSVYLGTANGLFHASADGRRIKRLDFGTPSITDRIERLYFEKDRLWVGGDDGLWELELVPGGEPVLRQHLAAELGDPRVCVVTGGKGSILWVGTKSGLVRLDRSTGALTRLPVDSLNPNALPGGMISSLLLDRQGRLWVGAFGRGIQVEDGVDAQGRMRFRRLTTHDGLPQNSVDMLLMDAKGMIWASTDDGLAQIDPANLAVRAFRAEQGVGLKGHWVGAGTIAASGELIFGGIGGITVVHPERPASTGNMPHLTITEARVGGQPVPAGVLAASQALQITARDRSLFVEFSALDFADPKHQRYSYRLAGFDPDWVNTPNSRRLASYTNLPPGDYTMEVRVTGPDGQWMPPLERAVHVQPAWYQHTGLRIAGGIVALMVFVGLVQLRTVYLRQRQRELQRLVAERTAELERRGVELRRSQEQLEQMAYFDSLTGLPNRRMFNDEMRRLIARSQRGQGDFALLLVDLDGFKQVNDVDGHDAGDALLVAVAERLKLLVRETDRVARLGGDEFAVLLSHSDADGGIDATCTRMLASLGEPLPMDGRTIQATASIGVAVCPQEGTSADGLYKSADLALYEAKRAGRNTWRWRLRESMPV